MMRWVSVVLIVFLTVLGQGSLFGGAVWHGRAFLSQEQEVWVPVGGQESTEDLYVYSSFFPEGTPITIVSVETQYQLHARVLQAPDLSRDRLLFLPPAVFSQFKEEDGFFVSVVYDRRSSQRTSFKKEKGINTNRALRLNSQLLSSQGQEHSISLPELADPAEQVFFPYEGKQEFLQDFYQFHREKNTQPVSRLYREEGTTGEPGGDFPSEELSAAQGEKTWSASELFAFFDTYSAMLCQQFSYRCTDSPSSEEAFSAAELEEFTAWEKEILQKERDKNVDSTPPVLWLEEVPQQISEPTLPYGLGSREDEDQAESVLWKVEDKVDPTPLPQEKVSQETAYTIHKSEVIRYPEAPLPPAAELVQEKKDLSSLSSLSLRSASREQTPLEDTIFLGTIPYVQVEGQSSYIQLATYSHAQSLRYIHDTLPKLEPLGYSKHISAENGSLYRLLLGPVERDQLGYLLAFYRNQGFEDAFVISPYTIP